MVVESGVVVLVGNGVLVLPLYAYVVTLTPLVVVVTTEAFAADFASVAAAEFVATTVV